ncbi:hypothetical protein QBC47DRAFT_366079 [Echria macrotheca]|uniref:Uncharacterized protein n=1 Tax=Echria macrotheca TaxID=438768 RepID=A0AAJ0B0R8_9PEZI|nr:hypothetical protein QBC47DRAFT_366079 [Echria macrotheca]
MGTRYDISINRLNDAGQNSIRVLHQINNVMSASDNLGKILRGDPEGLPSIDKPSKPVYYARRTHGATSIAEALRLRKTSNGNRDSVGNCLNPTSCPSTTPVAAFSVSETHDVDHQDRNPTQPSRPGLHEDEGLDGAAWCRPVQTPRSYTLLSTSVMLPNQAGKLRPTRVELRFDTSTAWPEQPISLDLSATKMGSLIVVPNSAPYFPDNDVHAVKPDCAENASSAKLEF